MLRRLILKNFKCFENLELSLKNLNVLMGLNGIGKSSVLQSLLLLRQSYQENKLTGLKLNGKYVSLGNGSDVLSEKAEKEQIEIMVEDERQFLRTCFSYVPESEFMENEISCEDISEEHLLFGDRFVYLSAYRIESRDLYHITDEKELKRRELANTGEYALHYLSVYGGKSIENAAVVFNRREEDGFLAGQVQRWMSLIAPGVMPQVIVNKSLRTAELRYEFLEGKEKTNAYKSVNVGFGITYVLPIVISILSARPGDLLLLENPEAHIHPAGQRYLGELMARASAGGVQILVETHSDHVLNGIRLAVKAGRLGSADTGIFFFYKEKEEQYRHKVISPVLDSGGNIDVWPEGFLDEWDKALIDLL